MREKQCTCPHHYTATGLQRFGTDATCPVHGAPVPTREPTGYQCDCGATIPAGYVCGGCFVGRPGGQ